MWHPGLIIQHCLLLLLIVCGRVHGALPRAQPADVGLSPVLLEEANFIAKDFIARGKKEVLTTLVMIRLAIGHRHVVSACLPAKRQEPCDVEVYDDDDDG